MMKRILTFLLCFCLLLRGEEFYVAENSAGTDTGADVANAHSMAWLNTPGNSGAGAGKVSAGDTVHLSGTFTTAFDCQGGGTSGSPVTIDFLPGAKFSKAVWASTGAMKLNGKDWLVIDGKGVGIIENTDNGTGLGNHVNSVGIESGECADLVIKDLTVRGMYVSNPAVHDDNRYGYCISVGGTRLTVSGCVVSDGDGLINVNGPQPGSRFTTMDNVSVLNSTFNDFNHGLNAGIGTGGTVVTSGSLVVSSQYFVNRGSIVHNGSTLAAGTTFTAAATTFTTASGAPVVYERQNVRWNEFVIAGNYFGRSTTWDNSSDHHADDIIFFNNTYDPSVRMDGLHIYRNTFSKDYSTTNTAAVFIAHYNPDEQLTNTFIHDNLFLNDTTSWGNGMISCSGNGTWAFSNTGHSTGRNGGGFSIGGTNCRVYNNLVMSGKGIGLTALTRDALVDDNTSGQSEMVAATYLASMLSDYNCFPAEQTGELDFSWSVWGSLDNASYWLSGIFHDRAGWNNWNGLTPTLSAFAGTRADQHSNTNVPSFVPGTYVPASGDTACRGAGVNLTLLLPSDIVAAHPEVLQDFNGNQRQATGSWTIGAFEGDASANTVRKAYRVRGARGGYHR